MLEHEQERWRRSIDRALESFRETAEFIRRSEESGASAEGEGDVSRETGSRSAAP